MHYQLVERYLTRIPGNLVFGIVVACALAGLVYAPLIPHTYEYRTPYICANQCSIPPTIETYLNSITFELFHFGLRYSLNSGSYSFCPTQGCGVWYAGIFYAILIVSIATDVGLFARAFSNKSGMNSASLQIGVGALVLLSTLLQLYSPLIQDEVLVSGTVIALTGVVELLLFSRIYLYQRS